MYKKNNKSTFFNHIPSINPNKKYKKSADFEKDSFFDDKKEEEDDESEFDEKSFVYYPDPDSYLDKECEEEEEVDQAFEYQTSPPNFVPNDKQSPKQNPKQSQPQQDPFFNVPPFENPFGPTKMDETTNTITMIKKIFVLPSDKKQFEREEQEDELYGITDKYKCEICRIIFGTSIKGECCKTLQSIQIMMEESRGSVKIETLYVQIVECYNTKIYEKLHLRQRELKPWNVAMLRYHDKNCDIKDIKKMLWEDIDFLKQQQLFLRKKGMIVRTITNEHDSSTDTYDLDPRKYKAWRDMQGDKLKNARFLYAIEKDKNKTKQANSLYSSDITKKSGNSIYDLFSN